MGSQAVDRPSNSAGQRCSASGRVALFTDTFFEINGAAHTLRKVAQRCQDVGLGLDVYCYGPDEGIEERGSVRVLRFPNLLSYNYYEKLKFDLLPNFRLGEAFRRSHRAQRYDWVHLATPGSIGLAGRTLARKLGLRALGTYHTHLAEYVELRCIRPVAQAMNRASWRFMRWFYSPCHWLLAPTAGGTDLLRSKGFGMNLGVLGRGIDTNLYSVAKRRRTDRRVVTTYVGRCAVEKNVLHLGPIVDGTDTEVWVVGDGPERPRLERELRNARFTGYLHGEDLAAAYADSDILLFPSTTDTFGNVVLEAMASGVAPIVAAGPGPSHYVEHGVNAMVGEGVAGMRQALRRLLESHDLRESMRMEARRFAESRSWDQAIEPLLNLYRQNPAG